MIALLPSATLLVLALGGASPDPDGLAREVLALASTGDPGRLARASTLIPESLREDPAFRGARAASALARLVEAAELRERSAASPDGEPGLRRARLVREEALEELRVLLAEAPDDPDVLRALAVYYGLDGRAEEAALLGARVPGGATGDDAWVAFALVAAAARGRPPAEAEPLLLAFIASRPGIHPPRLSLARARLARGDGDGALEALDALLQLDPDHGAAQEMKASLLAPPPVERVVPAAPTAAPPPSPPGLLPRKKARGAARSG